MAHASACPGVEKTPEKNTTAVMRDMLRNTGVTATAANLLKEFNMPPNSDTNEINNKYGNVRRVNATAKSNFSGSSEKPGASANIVQGIAICITITRQNNEINRIDSVCSANIKARTRPCFSRIFENKGMNPALNAPSANRRRKKLGNLNATKKASATGLAPKIAAIKMSRTKPSNLLVIVKNPTVAKARKKFIYFILQAVAKTTDFIWLYMLRYGCVLWHRSFGNAEFPD